MHLFAESWEDYTFLNLTLNLTNCVMQRTSFWTLCDNSCLKTEKGAKSFVLCGVKPQKGSDIQLLSSVPQTKQTDGN